MLSFAQAHIAFSPFPVSTSYILGCTTPCFRVAQRRQPNCRFLWKGSTPTPTNDDRGPQTPAPDYSAIDSNPLNALFTRLFLARLEAELGQKAVDATGFSAVVQVVRRLANRYRNDPEELRAASQRVISSFFPKWLPPAFVMLFSKPLPAFAARINAVITVAVTQWLMGPSRLTNDNTVEIERCRYLEETGCVGICLNSCKIATEGFFESNMGIPLAIEPNLEDFSCKFHFGKNPPPPYLDDMYKQPCLSKCPSASVRSQAPCYAIGDSNLPNEDSHPTLGHQDIGS